eukprot:250674-Rhodomonas_salina.7
MIFLTYDPTVGCQSLTRVGSPPWATRVPSLLVVFKMKSFDDGIEALLQLRATLIEARTQGGQGKVSQILEGLGSELKRDESRAGREGSHQSIGSAQVAEVDEQSETWRAALRLQGAFKCRLARRALRV